MTVRGEILLLILLCMLVTIVPRVLPFLAAHRLRLAPLAVSWFRLLPAAILSALLTSGLFFPGGRLLQNFAAPELPAALLAALVALKTRSIIFTIIAGMAAHAILSKLL